MNETHASNAASLTDFIARRIHDLRARKTLSQIAHEAGFRSRSGLSAIAAGSARLPLDHTVRLARALECDVHEFAVMSLDQFLPDDLLEVIAGEPEGQDEWPNVLATSVALAAEISGLEDDLKSVTNLLEEARDAIIKIDATANKLRAECSSLAAVARSQAPSVT